MLCGIIFSGGMGGSGVVVVGGGGRRVGGWGGKLLFFFSLSFNAPIQFLTQSCDPSSRYGKPVERTDEIISRPI